MQQTPSVIKNIASPTDHRRTILSSEGLDMMKVWNGRLQWTAKLRNNIHLKFNHDFSIWFKHNNRNKVKLISDRNANMRFHCIWTFLEKNNFISSSFSFRKHWLQAWSDFFLSKTYVSKNITKRKGLLVQICTLFPCRKKLRKISIFVLF